MHRFNVFFEENRKSRKYVSIQYDYETQRKLMLWAIENGFDLTMNYDGVKQSPESFDFHTTIFYSENFISLKNEIIALSVPKQVSPIGVSYIGEQENIPVIDVESVDISKIRKYYERTGLKDKWPSYRPHISLSYNRQAPPMNLSMVPLPNFPMNFDRILIDNVKESI